MSPRESPVPSAASPLAAVPGGQRATGRGCELPPAGADRTVIDLATGVMMARCHCGVAEATEQLVLLGWSTKRSVGEVAQSIVDELAGGRPDTQNVHPPRGDVDRANTRYLHLIRGGLDRPAGQESTVPKRPAPT